MAGRRLAAKYDLVVVEEGRRAVILDWKTAGRRPQDATVEGRLQTRVYPYLLALAGGVLNDGTPLSLRTDRDALLVRYVAERAHRDSLRPRPVRSDGAYLAGLLGEISGRPPDGFERTEDLQRCRLCTYRSLCDRGAAAGHGDLDEDVGTGFSPSVDGGDEAIGLDYAEVGEVSF